MFEINQVLVHKDHGLCKIVGIEHVQYVDKDYYVLHAKNNEKTKIMVPCDKIDELCRNLITKEDLVALIDKVKKENDDFIVDNKKRKEEYYRMLQSGDLFQIAMIIKFLKHLFKEKKANNKMIGSIDLTLFNDAKEKLYSEFQFVLGLQSFDEVEQFILKRQNA